jgi:hypothetical protein
MRHTLTADSEGQEFDERVDKIHRCESESVLSSTF